MPHGKKRGRGNRCTMTYPPHERKKWGAEGVSSPVKLRTKHAVIANRIQPEHCSRRRPKKQESRPHPDLPKDNNYLNRRILKKKYTCTAI